jgi:hypothetical protein
MMDLTKGFSQFKQVELPGIFRYRRRMRFGQVTCQAGPAALFVNHIAGF